MGKAFSLEKTFCLRALGVTGLVFFVVFCACFYSWAGQVVDRVVAVVNEDVIRLRELEEALEPVRQQLESRGLSGRQLEEELYKAREDILDDMIDEKLADQQTEQSGISVGDSEVDAAIEQVKQRNQYSGEDLKRALRMQGMTMDQYRREMKQQIMRSRLVNRKVRSNIVVTEQDIKRYYEANPEEFGGKAEYELRNILINPAQFDEQNSEDKVFARAELIEKELDKGASFEQVARRYSDAPNSADGGKLGRFALEDISGNLRQLIEDLEKGEHSRPVETPQGFQIFFVEDIAGTEPEPLEEVSDQIGEKLHEKLVNEKYEKWIKSLRKDAYIRIIR